MKPKKSQDSPGEPRAAQGSPEQPRRAQDRPKGGLKTIIKTEGFGPRAQTRHQGAPKSALNSRIGPRGVQHRHAKNIIKTVIFDTRSAGTAVGSTLLVHRETCIGVRILGPFFRVGFREALKPLQNQSFLRSQKIPTVKRP